MLLEKFFELHEWEMNKFPFIRTATGRHIYICLVRTALASKHDGDISIKKMLSSDFFTDRAIRLKIREMERAGFLRSEMGVDDRRVVTVRPSDSLKALIQEHSMLLDQLISRDVIFIKKSD